MPKLGSDYILDVIHAEAVTHIFMVPGGLIDPFLASLGRSRVTPIVAAQEGGAAYMADGFARASGRFGVALGIGGPGLGNMVTAVAAASTDGSPLLVLSGEVATRMEGLGQFQDASSQTLDDVAVLKSVTRYSTSVDGADNLPHLLRHALARMTDVPAGPVHLSLPQDVLSAPIDVEWKSRDPLAQNPRSLSLPMANRALARILRRPAR